MGAIAVDGFGNIYVTGGTNASDLPAVNAEMPKKGRWINAFVSKFDPNGRPMWSSYVGGSTGRSGTTADPGGDFAFDIAVDPSGQAAIVGRTTATDFPVVNAFQEVAQTAVQSSSDGFIAKLSSDGKRLVFSSYFGGPSGDSRLTGVAAGPAGEVWAGGTSTTRISTQFDVAAADSNQVIVLRLNPAGGVVWSTRMSGTALDGFAVDGLGQAHVGAHCGTSACVPFAAKLSASGSQQLWRTRVTNNSSDRINRLSVNTRGEAIVSGTTLVTESLAGPWPAVWNLQGSVSVTPMGFVRVLDASGTSLSYNTLTTAAGVYTAADDRLAVAVNTREPALLTEKALAPKHVDGPIYVSDNGAATWTSIGGPQAAVSMALDQQRDELYVSNAGFTYRSPDGGLTWFRESFGPYFAIDPRDSTIQWYSTGTGSAKRRVNGGSFANTGATLTSAPNATFALAVSPLDGNAWVGGDFGVEVIAGTGREFKMENAGLPQRTTIFGASPSAVRSFAFDPGDPNVVYAGTDEGLCVRTGGTTGWMLLTSQLNDGAQNRPITAVAVDPNNAATLLIGRKNGIYRSADRGQTWQRVSSALPTTIVPDPNRAGVFYAGADMLYRSIDGGASWEQASNGYESRFAPGPFVISARTSRLYVSSAELQSVPFVMNIVSSAPYSRSWATYLENGTVTDVAKTPSGSTAIALVTALGDLQSVASVVLIGR